MGDALDALDGAGWRALHSIPPGWPQGRGRRSQSGGDPIHHLLIGPGGIFALHALPAHRRRVRVTPPLVDAGRGRPVPLLDRLRGDADRAAFALAVEVGAVLVLVDPSDVEFLARPRDVQVLRTGELPSLGRQGGVLKPADVESVYATARDRNTWLR